MQDRPISGDKHIDLTYCPPDLWSAQAPAKWRRLVPRVEELEDGPADSISKTTRSTPARARSRPSIMPAGPPPTMQQRTIIVAPVMRGAEPDLRADLLGFLMWTLQEVVQDAKLVQQLERGGMDRVSSEVTEKVRVLLQDHEVDAGAG